MFQSLKNRCSEEINGMEREDVIGAEKEMLKLWLKLFQPIVCLFLNSQRFDNDLNGLIAKFWWVPQGVAKVFIG